MGIILQVLQIVNVCLALQDMIVLHQLLQLFVLQENILLHCPLHVKIALQELTKMLLDNQVVRLVHQDTDALLEVILQYHVELVTILIHIILHNAYNVQLEHGVIQQTILQLVHNVLQDMNVQVMELELLVLQVHILLQVQSLVNNVRQVILVLQQLHNLFCVQVDIHFKEKLVVKHVLKVIDVWIHQNLQRLVNLENILQLDLIYVLSVLLAKNVQEVQKLLVVLDIIHWEIL